MTKEELKKEAEEYYEDETEGTFQICEDCYWFADAVQTAYVDSAEPREKRIAELEQENKVLAQNLEDTEIVNKSLEKENAELKSGCGMCYRKDKDQLTKAKELLKEFVHHYKDKTIYIENMQDLLEQVERFIKDSEVEK